MTNIPSPTPIHKIPQIETLNNIRINVFGYANNEIFPLQISKRNDVDCINLFLITRDEGTSHYCLIRDMSRLLADRSKHRNSTNICYTCLHRYSSAERLAKHLEYCKEHTPQNVHMPEPEKSIIEFKNQNYQHPIKYIIYADFEALITTPMHTATPNPLKPFTQEMDKHQACGYCYAIVGPDEKAIKSPQVYRGEDAVVLSLQPL